MAPPRADGRTVSYRRTHNLLLATRLLNQRDTTSPFTLILDSLNQSARPLVKEYIRRASISKIKIIYISFESLHAAPGVDVFINARRKPLQSLHKEIASHTTSTTNKHLIIIDTLHPLCTPPSSNNSHQQPTQPNIYTSLAPLLTPTASLLCIYHTDIHIPSSPSNYAPGPLTLLKYLCTTMISIHNPSQIFEQKRAIDRSLPPPQYGVDEGVEGVLISLKPVIPSLSSSSSSTTLYQQQQQHQQQQQQQHTTSGIILELEHRRKSGRGVVEWYYLPPYRLNTTDSTTQYKERIILLEDHPLYSPHVINVNGGRNMDGGGMVGEREISVDDGLTFSLSLTDKQKVDREGIVLPYFDAQKEGGGMGGRILYVPGREDDWDEEEDEI